MTRIRDDKDWSTATNLAELRSLFNKKSDSIDLSLLLPGDSKYLPLLLTYSSLLLLSLKRSSTNTCIHKLFSRSRISGANESVEDSSFDDAKVEKDSESPRQPKKRRKSSTASSIVKKESNGDKDVKQERDSPRIFADIKVKEEPVEKKEKPKETPKNELKIKEEPLDVKIKDEPREEPEAMREEAEDEEKAQFYAFVNKDVRRQFVFIFY